MNPILKHLRLAYPEANISIAWAPMDRKHDKGYCNWIRWDLGCGPMPCDMAKAVAMATANVDEDGIASDRYRFRLAPTWTGYIKMLLPLGWDPIIHTEDGYYSPMLQATGGSYYIVEPMRQAPVPNVIAQATDLIRAYRQEVDYLTSNLGLSLYALEPDLNKLVPGASINWAPYVERLSVNVYYSEDQGEAVGDLCRSLPCTVNYRRRT